MAKKEKTERQKRAEEVIKRLKKEYPQAGTALISRTPFELLVATILSAQTTDVHVNKVTERLFEKYPHIEDFANMPLEKLQEELNSINYYKTKASNIRKCAQTIIENFGGEVPRTMEEITTLPGIARKTGNIILSHGYGVIEGIAVDTHVKRLSARLGFTEHKDPVKIERDLMELAPKKEWPGISNRLIFHGRKVCKAKTPLHDECRLRDICPSSDI